MFIAINATSMTIPPTRLVRTDSCSTALHLPRKMKPIGAKVRTPKSEIPTPTFPR